MRTISRNWRSRTAILFCPLTLALLGWFTVWNARAVTYSALSSFYGTNGAQPYAGLTLANGNFYGVTLAGGLYGQGTIFKATHAGVLTNLGSFDGTTLGGQPYGQLTLGADGNLYGTTSIGGQYGYGSVFVVGLSGGLTNLASFNGTNGANPRGPLLQNSGTFYGTASGGGANGYGTVYSLSAAGQNVVVTNNVTVTYSVDTNGVAQTYNGVLTNYVVLTNSSTGTLLNNVLLTNAIVLTNSTAGVTNYVFLINNLVLPNRNMTVTNTVVLTSGVLSDGQALTTNSLATFRNVYTNMVINALASFDGTNNGARPYSGLVLSGGTLYGTASGGGANSSGTIFSITPNGTRAVSLTLQFAFTGDIYGQAPQSGLIVGMDGNLYGTTAGGGTNLQGVCYVYGSGYITNVCSFANTNGVQPVGPLYQGSDTNFYGTTAQGGTHGGGSVYRIAPDGTLTSLYSFQGGNDGATPEGGLVRGTNGNLYGVASAGGIAGKGTFFVLSNFPPIIITSPAGNTFAAGSTITLSVGADGSAPLSYYWLLGTNYLHDGGVISGSHTPTLTISNITTAWAGTYAIVVRNATGIASNGTAVIQVVNLPTLTISSPAPNALVMKSNITVRGGAANNFSVQSVSWQLNGTGWHPATMINSSWSASVSLSPGTNTFQAYALNILNLASLTNSINIIYSIGRAPIQIQVSGKGTIPALHNNQLLDISRTYTVTAQPVFGNVVSNFTVSSNGVVLASTDLPKVSFNMQSNILLQATFMPSPFTNVSGSYHGLFYVTNRDEFAQTNSGSFTLSVVSGGTFSGYLQIGFGRYPTSGRFHIDGSATATIIRRGLLPLLLTLQLDLAHGSDRITGTVTDGTWLAQLDGDLAVFNGRTLKAPQMGRYTMVIPGTNGVPTEPAGDGYGIVSVSPAGLVQLTGTLADGTPINQAVPLSMNGSWPAYVPLYAGQGSLIGWLTLTNAPADALGGTMGWIKPPTKSKYYSGGFTYFTSAIGSLYQAPGAKTNVLSLAQAQLVLSGGNLASNLTYVLDFGLYNRVTNVVVPKPGSFSFTITTANGLFSGSTVSPGAKAATVFRGVVLQDQQVGRGFSLGTNQSSKVFLGNAPE